LKLDRDKLIRAREMLGYGIETVAEEAGVSKNSVLRAEHEEDIRPVTARKIAVALGVRVADLIGESETLKAEAPPPEPTLFNGLEDERRLQYLRPWRAFVHGLARRWEQQPPNTSAEISPLFEAMTALVEQGVFEPSEASAAEAHELMLLMVGFQRLNDIADKVEKDEEAEKRRATFALIREKTSA
jgi:transcriptional regulator with XRE-family HTH domain